MKALVLVLLLAACTPSAPPPPPIPAGHIGMSKALLTYLDTQYGSQERELAVLLFGVQDGLVVRVMGVDDTHMEKSTPVSGRFVSLHPHDDPRVIGFFHNHPNRPAPRTCAPSHTDIETLYKNPLYRIAIVGCGSGRFGAALRGHGTYLEFTIEDGYP